MSVKYDRIVCINLDRRPEKWDSFLNGVPNDFPFGKIERYPAVDGQKIPKPDWWKGGGGAWGCYLSHRRIIEECLNQGINRVLIFEDDALFLPGFTPHVLQFHENLPANAQWIYYGGQHLRRDVQRPEKINEFVYRPYNVNRTHAYGLIGREALQTVEKHLSRKDWTTAHHVDHHFGRLHQKQELNVYCPSHWLVDQREGRSDVAGRRKNYCHWWDAEAVPDISSEPFYAVVGCHSSGSSALAGILYHLGIHLGNVLTGAHGQPPIRGGEALDLQQLFEQAAPVPAVDFRLPESLIAKRLKTFVNKRRLEAKQKGTFAAGKYPQLGATGNLLPDMLGDNLKLIVCNREFEQSVASLHQRFPKQSEEDIRRHQKWIDSGIGLMKSCVSEDRQISVDYDDMLSCPGKTVERLIAFIGLEPDANQIQKAINYIKPELRHVF